MRRAPNTTFINHADGPPRGQVNGPRVLNRYVTLPMDFRVVSARWRTQFNAPVYNSPYYALRLRAKIPKKPSPEQYSAFLGAMADFCRRIKWFNRIDLDMSAKMEAMRLKFDFSLLPNDWNDRLSKLLLTPATEGQGPSIAGPSGSTSDQSSSRPAFGRKTFPSSCLPKHLRGKELPTATRKSERKCSVLKAKTLKRTLKIKRTYRTRAKARKMFVNAGLGMRRDSFETKRKPKGKTTKK